MYYMFMGRPPGITKYNPEFHDKSIVELCTATDERMPMTINQIACEWNVNPDSIYEWRKVHPSFSDAFSRARAAHKAWFDDQVKKGLFDITSKDGTTRLNTNAIKFYAFLHFGDTDKNGSYIDLPIEYKTASFERRAEILIEMLSEGKISAEQYETLDRVLTAQYQRSRGDDILKAEEALRKAEGK